MKPTLALIEQVRMRLPKQTNYAVAKALHMPQSQLTEVLKGKFGLGNKAVVRIAEILGRDIGDILTLIEEDKARTDDDKEFWGRRSPRITASSVIAIVALGLAGIITKSGNVHAEGTVYNDSHHMTNLYIMRSLKKFLTFAKQLRNKLFSFIPGGAPAEAAVT